VVNRSIDLKTRGGVYEAYVRSVLLYGTETWALTDRLMDVLQGCDCKMSRYMAGVKWQDGKSSIEVRDMCRVEDLSVKMRQRRMGLFGHVRSGGSKNLRQAAGGKAQEEWRACLTEIMNTLAIKGHIAQD